MRAVIFLPLSQGKVALIDKKDFKKVGRVKWSAMATPSGNFYAVRQVNRKNIYLHGAIMGSGRRQGLRYAGP